MKREKEFNAEKHITYHLNDKTANVFTENIRVEEGAYVFNVNYQGEVIQDIYLPVGGLHNVENILAAIAVAKQLNVGNEAIIKALKEFKGVRRRFEWILHRSEEQHTVLIDDYAHHPEELNALISGVRSLYKNEKLLLIFQPHLYSRTRDNATAFAESLDKADDVVVLPVYPARELPIEGVTSELITNRMKLENKAVLSKSEMLEKIKNKNHNLIVMAGAGDIGEMTEDVKKIILDKTK